MKKNTIQIIIGAPRSGKTKKVQELTKGKTSLDFCGKKEYLNYAERLNTLPEFIVIEGIGEKDFTFVNHLAEQETIKIRKLFQSKVDVFDMPNLIFTTLCTDYASFKTDKDIDVEIIQL